MAQVSRDPSLRAALFFVHGVGRNESAGYHAWDDTMSRLAALGLDPESLADCYRPVRYLFDIERYYAAADVLVCRGGAGSIVEAAAFGKPLLVIPHSALPGGHQEDNARALEREGACRVLAERRSEQEEIEDVDPAALLREVRDLASLDDARKAEMGKNLRQFYRADCAQQIVAVMNRAVRARNV